MLHFLLSTILSEGQVIILASLIAFLLTFFMLMRPFPFLPRDHGRAYAINGALSKGKLRGVGLVLTASYAVVSVLLLHSAVEYLIYCVLLILIMLSGYFDDASETPWSDYKKGFIDLVISIATMVTFLMNDTPEIHILSYSITLPAPVYFILGIILIWTAINVTNCSDGVDGLCGTITICIVLSYALIFKHTLREYTGYSCVMAAVIGAYLLFNSSPSSMLMGDAGSRTFGFFIALLSMKSGHPLSFLILSLVFIIDGGLGLVKVFLLRFLKIAIFRNTRFPLHDQLRKVNGWSDTQVVVRLTIIQILLAVAFYFFFV